jgi:hypothetical protein
MGSLGAHFRTGYSLSEREREIAVITINSKWHSIYPTSAHEGAGKAAGLSADKVEALLSGVPTSFTDTRDKVATRWPFAWPIHGGSPKASTTVPSKRLVMLVLPT